MLRALLLLLLAARCGGLRSAPDSGSAGGGSGTGGGVASGGGSGGSGGGTGGGVTMDGGVRPFTWGKMSTPASTGFQGIWGLGSGASVILYVNQHSSRIARFQNAQWATVYQDPSNANLVSLWVSPNEEVFAVGSFFANHCLSGCTMQSAWTHRSVPSVTFTGVCGSDLQHVYAVGNGSQGKGVLLKFNPSTQAWDVLSSDTASHSNEACWVAPDDAVFIAAQSTVVRYDGITFTPETVEFPASWTINDKAGLFLEAVSGGGGELYAAGAGKRVLWRDAPGHWVIVFDASSMRSFEALAVDANGALAAGGTQSGESIAARGARREWTWETSAPDFAAWSAWVAGPNEYFLAGYEAGSGAIYRGTR